MRAATVTDNRLIVGPPVTRIGAILMTQSELTEYLDFLVRNELTNTEHYDTCAAALHNLISSTYQEDN